MEKNIALIPAYNPDYKLINLIAELINNKFVIVVVNDGSNNDSLDIFNTIRDKCILIDHEVNKGKGVALKTGLQFIVNNFNDYVVVTLDCDGQHTIKDTINICKYANENTDSLILGSRMFNTNDVPVRSKLGNKITRGIFHLVTGNKIYDTQTGLRAFSEKIAKELLHIDGDRFEYEINVLLDFSKRKIPIKEIEIETVYIDNNSSSHFKPIRDSFKIYKQIFKYIFMKKN